jgi:hypothetical protein
MNRKTPLFLAGIAAALLSGAAMAADASKLSGVLKKYAIGVQDAQVPEATEIANNLLALTPANDSLAWSADKTKVKVVTWKSQNSYQNNLAPYTQTSGNEAFVVWVTLAPRIQEFCRNYLASHPKAGQAELETRLKQRLGLHPQWQYDVFVELWVDPADIFRPCVDPDPSDTACELNFGATVPAVKNIQDYGAFYKNLYYGSFRAAPGVPWTGLGYTYDWISQKAEQGESEFILSPSTPYTIEQAVPTLQYCSP